MAPSARVVEKHLVPREIVPKLFSLMSAGSACFAYGGRTSARKDRTPETLQSESPSTRMLPGAND